MAHIYKEYAKTQKDTDDNAEATNGGKKGQMGKIPTSRKHDRWNMGTGNARQIPFHMDNPGWRNAMTNRLYRDQSKVQERSKIIKKKHLLARKHEPSQKNRAQTYNAEQEYKTPTPEDAGATLTYDIRELRPRPRNSINGTKIKIKTEKQRQQKHNKIRRIGKNWTTLLKNG